MNKYLEQLVLLSKIDQEIDSFEPKIECINKNLKDIQIKIEKIEFQISNCEEEIKDIKNQKVQNNNHILEFSEKIKDLSKKSASIKTEKEANALKIEEDIAKEQLDAAHEEIVRLDKILDNKETQKSEFLKEKEKLEQDLESTKENIKVEMEAIEKDRMKVCDKKAKLVDDINQKVLTFYQKIRKWAKNTAVVPVKKQACYGCFMKIYDKTYLSILKGEEIVTCPHCGRILYKESEEEAIN